MEKIVGQAWVSFLAFPCWSNRKRFESSLFILRCQFIVSRHSHLFAQSHRYANSSDCYGLTCRMYTSRSMRTSIFFLWRGLFCSSCCLWTTWTWANIGKRTECSHFRIKVQFWSYPSITSAIQCIWLFGKTLSGVYHWCLSLLSRTRSPRSSCSRFWPSED